MQGIYILMTSDGFRVAPLQFYENLYDGYRNDMTQYINKDYLVANFGDCKLMTEMQARMVAKEIAGAYRELPDGIRTITTYRKYSFEDLKNGAASKN